MEEFTREAFAAYCRVCPNLDGVSKDRRFPNSAYEVVGFVKAENGIDGLLLCGPDGRGGSGYFVLTGRSETIFSFV